MSKKTEHVLVPSPQPNLSSETDGYSDIVTRILLICDAEGMHDRYASIVDDAVAEGSGLTALGWEQADTLASWLMTHETIDVLASGAQLYSRLTAQRIGQALGLPVTVAPSLPSQLGQAETFAKTGVKPDELDPEIHTSTHNMVVEPYVEFHHALISTLTQLLRENIGQTIALVTSTSAIATLLRHFFGAHRLQVSVDHTSLSEIDHQNGQWRLLYVNRSEHLPRPPLIRTSQPTAPSLAVGEDDDLALIAQIYNVVASEISPKRTQEQSRNDAFRLQHFVRFAQLPHSAKVLDIGSGTGALALSLAATGVEEVVGIDVSLVMLEYAEYARLSRPSSSTQRVSFRLAPAQLMPFRNERFNAAVCRLVLHHARNPERILREILRVLEPGGQLVLAELLGADDPVKRATYNAIESRRNPGHMSAYSVEQYRRFVSEAGFIIEEEEVVVFERDLQDWLSQYQVEPANHAAVRDMVEAAFETDAAGINARHQGNQITLDQRLLYLKARKPA